MQIIRETQPQFYTGYRSARKVIETGVGRLTVKGSVSELLTGDSIAGALLEFVPVNQIGLAKGGNAGQPLRKRSADKGGFKLRHLAEGAYTVMASKQGYRSSVTTFYVTRHELSVVNVRLERL